MPSLDALYAAADAQGIGLEFRALCDAALGHGLVPYVNKQSVRFSSPLDRRRYLLTVWAEPAGSNGGLRVDLYPGGFSRLYPLSIDEAKGLLRDTEHLVVEELKRSEVMALIDGLDSLFELVARRG